MNVFLVAAKRYPVNKHLMYLESQISVSFVCCADWDHWVITTDDRVKHDAQFQFLKPVGGYITGHNGLSSVPSSNGQDSNISSTAYQDWIISSSNRPRYRLLFNQHDRNKRGYLTGVEARNLDKDGNLNCDEFCIAIFLIEKVLSGSQLPNTLPSGLLPSSQQRTTGHTSPSISVKQDDNESSENKSSCMTYPVLYIVLYVYK
ncbi:Intersectin-2 [Schistosoma japonicum]|nr:Intersectin-2 [Schistosoma japonicum]